MTAINVGDSYIRPVTPSHSGMRNADEFHLYLPLIRISAKPGKLVQEKFGTREIHSTPLITVILMSGFYCIH